MFVDFQRRVSMDGGHRLLRCRGQSVCVRNGSANHDSNNAGSDNRYTMRRHMSNGSLSVSVFDVNNTMRNN
jgi:hypothetical protein